MPNNVIRYLLPVGGRGNLLARLYVQIRQALALYLGAISAVFVEAAHKDEHDPSAADLRTERSTNESLLNTFDPQHHFEPDFTRIQVDNLNAELNQRLQLNGNNTLRDIGAREGPETVELLEMFFSEEDLRHDGRNGYEQGGHGCFVADESFACQLNKPGSIAGEIVHQVAQNQVCRVALTLSTVGGESKNHVPEMVNSLFDACVKEMEEVHHKAAEDAEAHVSKHLEIGLFILGDGMAVPNGNSRIDTAFTAINAEVLALLEGSDWLKRLAAIYYIASPEVFVQAEVHEPKGDQKTHLPLMMLAGCDCMNRFYEVDSADLRAHCGPDGVPMVQLSHLSEMEPPATHYAWDNIGMEQNLRDAILSRVSFGALLLLAVAPNTIDADQNQLINSTFLRDVYGKKALKKLCANPGEAEALMEHLRLVIEREKCFLKSISDISLTGTDWSSPNGPNYDRTSILNNRVLKEIVDGQRVVTDLSGFDLKELLTWIDSNGSEQNPITSQAMDETIRMAGLKTQSFFGEKNIGDMNKALRQLYRAASIKCEEE